MALENKIMPIEAPMKPLIMITVTQALAAVSSIQLRGVTPKLVTTALINPVSQVSHFHNKTYKTEGVILGKNQSALKRAACPFGN